MILEKEYDQDLKYGPTKKRKCTDVICMFGYVLITVFAVLVAMNSKFTGDMSRIARPYDSDGRSEFI